VHVRIQPNAFHSIAKMASAKVEEVLSLVQLMLIAMLNYIVILMQNFHTSHPARDREHRMSPVKRQISVKTSFIAGTQLSETRQRNASQCILNSSIFSLGGDRNLLKNLCLKISASTVNTANLEWHSTTRMRTQLSAPTQSK
jgi:hypothetical protein